MLSQSTAGPVAVWSTGWTWQYQRRGTMLQVASWQFSVVGCQWCTTIHATWLRQSTTDVLNYACNVFATREIDAKV